MVNQGRKVSRVPEDMFCGMVEDFLFFWMLAPAWFLFSVALHRGADTCVGLLVMRLPDYYDTYRGTVVEHHSINALSYSTLLKAQGLPDIELCDRKCYQLITYLRPT